VRRNDTLAGLEPKREVDRRGDSNGSGGNDWSWADMAQAAAMLSGVMRFLLIGVRCRLRAKGGAEDDQDEQEPANGIALT